MSKASEVLKKYLPEKAIEPALALLRSEPIDLKISKPRKTKLGDYRFPKAGSMHHRISVNADLNPYAFLITLVHEVAHLKAFKAYGKMIRPHGAEWQKCFIALCEPFFEREVFPDKIAKALRQSLYKGTASSCTDLELYRCLKQYDQQKGNFCSLEHIPDGSYFELNNGRLFRKGPRLRKRFKCLNLTNGREYMVHPLAEVLPVNKENQHKSA